jgi:hypothetical protein
LEATKKLEFQEHIFPYLEVRKMTTLSEEMALISIGETQDE